ncbi:MAG: hypothetical protein JWQ38_2902 [Flavipsychrobacter sp.]|nr:hypothetical protein [Flavipsychrobacter sp.]
MIAIQQQQQPAFNTKAALWTVGVHALLLLLFILLSYTVTPPVLAVPTVDSGGIEVNLGTSDNGSGKNQPMSKKAPAAYQATVVFKSAAVTSSLPKEIVQTTEPDAPEVDNTRHKNNAPTPAIENKPVTKPQEKPKYAYAGDHGPGGNSAAQNSPGTSEGNTHGPGDRGVPGGTPGAPNYTGIPGDGTGGIGHTLTGRDIYPKKFEAEFSESGKVVIHVTVNKSGAIINKRVKSTSSPQLTKLALEKINTVKFSASNGSEPEQSGDVTFYFKTRQ